MQDNRTAPQRGLRRALRARMTGARAWSACGALLFGLGMSCAPSWAAAPSASGLAALPAATATDACRMQRGAFLSARLRGAATLDVAWHGVALHCDGGARPDGRGMRVSFSGKDHAHRLVFIFGIDAAPRAGRAHNVATNVTVIFEGERRVYSTRGDDRCTLDALSTRPLSVQAGERRLAVRARGFCISPASALGSGAPLLVSRFDFSGAIFLDADASAGASPPTAHGRKQPAGH